MSFKSDNDRRAIARQRVHYRMDVCENSEALFGCLLDVSTTGMRVLCSEDVDVLNVSKLRIRLPLWLELGPEIRVEGRFVWCKAMARQRVEAGFSFGALKERERTVLEHLIQRLSQAADEDGFETVSLEAPLVLGSNP